MYKVEGISAYKVFSNLMYSEKVIQLPKVVKKIFKKKKRKKDKKGSSILHAR